MGNAVNKNQFYVYARRNDNTWKSKYLHSFIEEISALSHFKHIVWRFALQHEDIYKDYTTLYLYKGSIRIIKASLEREIDGFDKLTLTFLNDIYAGNWDTCEEKILNHDILWKETSFSNKFVPLQHDNEWTRKWLSIKVRTN